MKNFTEKHLFTIFVFFERFKKLDMQVNEANKVGYLYSKYADKIYNLAFQMTGDEELSKDILQETFIRVFENINTFRQESTHFTWMYKIAKNVCFSKLNQRTKRSISNIEDLIEKVSSTSENKQFSEVEKHYYINQVKDGCLLGVLRCLSLNQRIAFVLHVVLEVPVSEVSETIDITENAARILIHRAKKIIKGFLCKNCTLYGVSKKCRCENLISFSLAQGWIEKYNPTILPQNIEEEIKQLKDKLQMYRTITPKNLDQNVACIFKKCIKEFNFSIFQKKKVK